VGVILKIWVLKDLQDAYNVPKESGEVRSFLLLLLLLLFDSPEKSVKRSNKSRQQQQFAKKLFMYHACHICQLMDHFTIVTITFTVASVCLQSEPPPRKPSVPFLTYGLINMHYTSSLPAFITLPCSLPAAHMSWLQAIHRNNSLPSLLRSAQASLDFSRT
jgi:hypothetical protein